MDRLKVPPSIHQFSRTLDRNQGIFRPKSFSNYHTLIAHQLFKLLKKYAPETKKEKQTRLTAEADKKAKGDAGKAGQKAKVVKFGLNHVTTLVESKKAKLVAIAHDVDPIELVVHLPTLCQRMEVPFCFVKGKARLGRLVHQKTATCVALTEVRNEDFADLNNLTKNFKQQYNDNEGLRRQFGEGIMGIKNQHMMEKRRKLLEIEMQKKTNL